MIPNLAAFVTRPEFVAIATQLLGPDVDLYWNQSVFKQPEGKREFPWHQDDGYTPVTPSPYLTLWLALNDATVENGCISVLPGSHKRGLVPHRPSDIGLVCHDADDPDQGVPVPVKAGFAGRVPVADHAQERRERLQRHAQGLHHPVFGGGPP